MSRESAMMDNLNLSIVPIASAWGDIGVPLIIAFAGAALAAFWPWLQVSARRRRFQAIIRRELEELAPYPREPTVGKPWREHVAKRFVHQEIFDPRSISQNRDFLLSLNPDVVYRVSQLWDAYRSDNANQFEHFLKELAYDKNVGSTRLQKRLDAWSAILGPYQQQ